jgi:hypothetical protein
MSASPFAKLEALQFKENKTPLVPTIQSRLQGQIIKPRDELPNTLFNFSRVEFFEKEKNRCDDFTVIWGVPRSGKTMLMLQKIRHMAILQRWKDVILQGGISSLTDLHEKGYNIHLGKKWWADTYKNHFCLDLPDASRKIKKGGRNQMFAFDEGGDVATYKTKMTIENDEFIRLLQKIGELQDTFFYITALLALQDKDILRRAKWLYIIAHPHRENSNSAYVYKQWDDPARAEKNPFDLNDIFEKADKMRRLPTEQLYTKSVRYVGEVPYFWANSKVYELYLKMVKMPQMLNTDRKRRRWVPTAKYEKLLSATALMVYNLQVKDDKTPGMIRKLATTNDGKILVSADKVTELRTYGEHMFYKYAEIEDKLNPKTMDEKREAYRKAKEEAKQTEIEMKEIERLKEEQEDVAFRSFKGHGAGDFSLDEDDKPDSAIDDKKDDDEEF